MVGSTVAAIQQTRLQHTSKPIVKINLCAYPFIRFPVFTRKVTSKILMDDVIFDGNDQVF